MQRNTWYSRVWHLQNFYKLNKTQVQEAQNFQWEQNLNFFRTRIIDPHLLCLLRVRVIHSYIQIILQVLQCTERVSLSFLFKPAEKRQNLSTAISFRTEYYWVNREQNPSNKPSISKENHINGSWGSCCWNFKPDWNTEEGFFRV